jgi:ApaG protein
MDKNQTDNNFPEKQSLQTEEDPKILLRRLLEGNPNILQEYGLGLAKKQKKPVLKPGESHTYSSGCLLSSPHGAMRGFFNMINFTSTKAFKVIVPTFKLNAPFALN